MAHFKRLSNDYIYLYHWLDRTDSFKISTKMKVEKKNWNEANQRPINPKTIFKDRLVVNELLRYETILRKALVLQPELTKNTLPQFRELFLSMLAPLKVKKSVEQPLLPYFELHVKKLKSKNQTNYKYYQTCYRNLVEYFGSKNPTFKDINMKFFEGFTEFLTRKNLSLNTIASRTKALKAVMQVAYVDGIHKNEAFRHFKKRAESADTIYLSENELAQIRNLKLVGHLEKARDYFIIGAFTGLRFEDWDRVSLDMVRDGIISVRSSKTGELSTIPLHPYVRSILDKYKGTLPSKGSNQKMNEYIKIVAARAGITDLIETRITQGGVKIFSTTEKSELVTTHTARRSLATNLVLRGVSPYVVMKVTGHKSLSSFEKYVRLQELEAMTQLKSLDFFH